MLVVLENLILGCSTMLTKPDLKDEKIIACLHDNYGLDVAGISFLPLGADFNTAVYRVTTTDKTDYFLKLRSGDFCERSVLVPHHLKQIGMQNIIPAIATKTDECWTNLDDFSEYYVRIYVPLIS